MDNSIEKVIVVGAGPVGLLTALMLGQQGINVDVLETADYVNESPRGLAYGPAAARILRKAGILDRILEQGYQLRSFCWRDANGQSLAGLSLEGPIHQEYEPFVVLPVGSLSAFLVKEIARLPTVRILWRHPVHDAGQDEINAWATVSEGEEEPKRFEADFIIGCDGGQSAIRRILFGRDFPGFTWPLQMVAVNLYYDFDKFGWSDCQWIVHPQDWYIACRINKKGLWRVAYGEEEGLSEAQINDRLDQRLHSMLPGRPEPHQYEIANVTPYRVHQRCAPRMRVGRFLLAGDAAHLNNPMGGYGLTTGVADAGSLVDCLVGIHTGKATPDILDDYDRIRRDIFNNIVDTTTTTNLKRIMRRPDEIKEDEFFAVLDRIKHDSATLHALYKHELSIGADMTTMFKVNMAGVCNEEHEMM